MPTDLVYLVDIDNTLLDNDAVVADLKRHLVAAFGVQGEQRYWAIFEELWQQLGYAQAQGELLDAPWPKVDEGALKQDEIELVLQVNGKHRGSILVPAGADKAAIEKIALASEHYIKFAGGAAAPKKVIIVPGRLVNLVV